MVRHLIIDLADRLIHTERIVQDRISVSTEMVVYVWASTDAPPSPTTAGALPRLPQCRIDPTNGDKHGGGWSRHAPCTLRQGWRSDSF